MVARADWQAVEVVKTYAITGQTGAELYASIGAKGPGSDAGRAIAHTSFKLTWTRKYEPQGGGCVLSTARPKLTITYVLPKPAGQLPASARASWQLFIDGVATHERVHGDHIKEMVRDIESVSVGLTVADDPKCRRIRTVLTEKLAELSRIQRQRSRDFDRVELSDGGAVHRLILALVNGG